MSESNSIWLVYYYVANDILNFNFFLFGRLVQVTESLKHYGSRLEEMSFQDIWKYKIRVESEGGIVPPIWLFTLSIRKRFNCI